VGKNRLEAFSDGVLAIIITIMVLELHAPESADVHSLVALSPLVVSYLISFLLVGIYWNNHHHMLHAVHHVNGAVLWANLHLLFWLSLVPFATTWMGETSFASWPVALYGIIQLMAGVAYYILARQLVYLHGAESTFGKALGRDVKGKTSVVIYALAVPVAFLNSWIAFAMFVAVAVMWLIPDRRFERAVRD